MDRRHFIKLSAALAVGAITQSACDDDPQGASADPADGLSASDTSGATTQPDAMTDLGADVATDAAADAVTDAATDAVEPPINYPRGEPLTFADSPVSAADPTASDGAQPFAFDPFASPEDAAGFPMGVQAGAMTSAGALLWTWVAPDIATSSVRLRVWRESTGGEVLLVLDQEVTPDDGGYVHVPVDGLAAGTRYRYAFGALDPLAPDPTAPDAWAARSRIGAFRTAFLEDGVGTLRIGASTCTNLRNTPYSSLQRLADADLDLFVHLGDMSYNDGARDLTGYREIWGRTLREPHMQALLASTGFYITWDDHEIDNNWNPEIFPAARLADAKRAFFETLAVPRPADDRIWRSYRWGKTAEVFLLDCRSERKPSTNQSDNPIYISPAQMDWIKQALLDSPCRFKVILNSVPATLFPGILGGTLLDAWGGYQAQRQVLIDHITNNNLRDVWFLSGDFHFGFISRLADQGDSRNLWEVAVGPGASNANPVPVGAALNLRGFDAEINFPPSMFRYWSAETKVATILTLDPVAATLRAQFIVGDTGEVLFDEALQQVMP
jgi:alkaline phosphatase D